MAEIYNKVRLLGELHGPTEMGSVRERSGEIRRLEISSRDHSKLQERQTNNETIGTTIEIMLEELDNLEPDETANLERNMLRKHLGRLIKVMVIFRYNTNLELWNRHCNFV